MCIPHSEWTLTYNKLMINLVGIAGSSKHALQVLKKAENYCLAATLQQIHYLLYMIVFYF